MLELTDSAVRKVGQLMEREEKSGFALRVTVQGGGCSGFQYGMSFEEEGRGDDVILTFGDLRVLVDPMSNLYLAEVQIDYVDSLTDSGFKFINPNATGTCGCGQSFSA